MVFNKIGKLRKIFFVILTILVAMVQLDLNSFNAIKDDASSLMKFGVTSRILTLQSYNKDRQKIWFKRKVPVFHDLVVVEGSYFAIFNVDGYIGDGKKDHYIDYADNHEWWCDNERGKVIGHDSPGCHTLIVKCPSISHQITAKPKENSKDGKEVRYDVTANLESIRTKPTMFPPQITHASCTAIKGEEYRKLLPQWIEHHRLIGIQHFFVYINEPFVNLDTLYARPYITYVPFDYHHYPEERPFYFQATWQNDCIYRAKNASVTWVGLHDTDEYWQPLEPPYNMDNVMEGLDPAKDAGRIIGNFWFGPHPDEKETFDMHLKPNNLLMDYTWRSPKTTGPGKRIVSPKLIDYFYVHWITKRDKRARWEQWATNKVRMNHYRRPYDHVHSYDDDKAVQLLVKDDSMRDMFKEKILEEINMNNWKRIKN